MSNYYKADAFPVLDLNSPLVVAQYIKQNIYNYKQLVLATTSKEGSPWAVSLNWRADKSYNFVWKSKIVALHSQNISRDGKLTNLIVFATNINRDFAISTNIL